jgi:hypothetical protein
MAFIPVDAVVQKAYPIQDEPATPVVAGSPTNPLGHTAPPATKSDMEIAAEEALRTGQGKIIIKSSNPKNVEKKMKEIRAFASTKRLKVQDNGDGTVTLIKWPS